MSQQEKKGVPLGVPNIPWSELEFKSDLGSGGFGIVKLAWWTKRCQQVAVKVLHETNDKKSNELLKSEISVMYQLAFACNIVKLLGTSVNQQENK